MFYPSIEDCLKAVTTGQAGCTTLNGPRFMQAGMNAQLSKPVEQDNLYQTPGELIWEAGVEEQA